MTRGNEFNITPFFIIANNQIFGSYNQVPMDSKIGEEPDDPISYTHEVTATERPPERNLSGWIILAVIFALLIGGQAYSTASHKQELLDTSRLDLELKEAITSKAVAEAYAKSSSQAANAKIDELLRTVVSERTNDASSAEVYGLLNYELGKPVLQSDIRILGRAKPLGPLLFMVLATPKFAASEAAKLQSQIPGDSFAHKLIKADLAAKAGMNGPRTGLYSDVVRSYILEYALIGGLAAGGLIAWIVFVVKLSTGSLRPLGLPNLPATLAGADQLALAALIFFAAYSGLLVVSELAAGGLHQMAGIPSFFIGLATIALYPFVVRSRWGNRGIGFASLGIRRDSPWLKYLGLGFFGFLLEFPVSALVGEAGEKLLPNQTSIHPAEAVLASSHSPWLVASLFLLASIQAPLYEETLFRGLLLPATTRVFGSLLGGILLTSFLFASIHPVGISGWPGLATIAAASSILIYYTGSIAPSIFLHAFHNAFTLVLVLALS
jgi:membrane protease YdiL (CAAX protease family)